MRIPLLVKPSTLPAVLRDRQLPSPCWTLMPPLLFPSSTNCCRHLSSWPFPRRAKHTPCLGCLPWSFPLPRRPFLWSSLGFNSQWKLRLGRPSLAIISQTVSPFAIAVLLPHPHSFFSVAFIRIICSVYIYWIIISPTLEHKPTRPGTIVYCCIPNARHGCPTSQR